MPTDAPTPVRRALLSVYDKAGIADFARRLRALDVELISTGGTAATLRDAGLAVTDVADVTGVPEVLEGRVKTLHPAIHAGILARRSRTDDLAALDEHDYAPIDLVVGNLYPFSEAVQDPDADPETVMEYVDIGGPTMLRAAAKNHFDVGVVSAPDQYAAVADELEQNDAHLSAPTRRTLAEAAFAHTSAYDQAIDAHLSRPSEAGSDTDSGLQATYNVSLPQAQSLRYGENPHQNGALYGNPSKFYEKLHGRALSYNNLLDTSSALALIDEFRDAGPTCAILKHTNPCGVATANTLEDAWQQAFATDTQSPYGGIVVVNRPLDRATAEAIDEIFTEIVIAPAFESGVLDFLTEQDRRRVVRAKHPARDSGRLDTRSVLGGALVQTRDPALPSAADAREEWDVPTARPPSDDERTDLDFAWRVAKHVKSNAIVYARDRATLGIGAGQMSRIDASELAVFKAGKSELDLTGSVVASDAFFPFADGLEAAASEGACAAIQPGGSIRDDEVIEAADAHDVAMVLTGQRHFRH
ncbi:bifunctional phosphoribosylaminoimidazolecarboxamide formyltransferase/IMP cyclohydrolase [Salinibacter altiplanensis]|uniref:bifunctional phosphoribosylaminoimidazolecarboxamide formyltransferase/IMP cyclohydrolase n=1 Tax=Salinibacter altiplanensis TaxID=1803181 RepID=UPI000C9EEA18|nr:bifunctional phosphoribosylaminoimidazolecarboxamide formyltransferase/IMP cyclohydrolase [Salinibacter altiplanensis]